MVGLLSKPWRTKDKYVTFTYRGPDKSLTQPGRKQATATEDFDVRNPICYHNWRNISNIYMYI